MLNSNTPSREDLRQSYYDIYQKILNNTPLTALEKNIAEVIAEHPEYHQIINNINNILDKDFLPEGNQTNPFLHMGLHLAIREQINTNRPNGIKDIYQKLRLKLPSQEACEHQMMEILVDVLWSAQKYNTQPDEVQYLNQLRSLLN